MYMYGMLAKITIFLKEGMMKKIVLFAMCLFTCNKGLPRNPTAAHALPAVPFYYIRHGETDSTKHNIVHGATDIPLNQTGIQQAHAAAQKLKKHSIATIVSSPLKRARQTAQIIAQDLEKPVIVIDDLRERSAGALEGEHYSSWLLSWITDKMMHHGVESPQKFTQRVHKAIAHALTLPGPVLIVAHGGVYSALDDVLNITYIDYLPHALPLLYTPPSAKNPAWQITAL